MISDQFFRSIPEDKTYDLVFVDVLHLEAQALRDIENSLKHINPSGTIVVHYYNPTMRSYQRKSFLLREYGLAQCGELSLYSE